MRQFPRVCVAGTFDTIHAGHEGLLRKAFDVGEQVLIGITSDSYVLRYKSLKSPKVLKSLIKRKQDLTKWLSHYGYLARTTIIPIDDPFEPAASDPSLDALVVSEETRDRGEELNQKREERGLSPLALIVIPLVPANGKLVMPESLRAELVKPLGRIVKRFKREGVIITVGDVTTKMFLDAGIVPKRLVIDHKVNRKPFVSFALPSLARVRVVSGPGYISQWALDAVKSNARIIEIEGEEDLLVLPVIAEAPLGSRVYYGQPGKGMVEVVVTQEKKEKAAKLLSQFT